MPGTLSTGLYLTVAGMGLVFLLLGLLWALLTLLLRLDRPPAPAPEAAPQRAAQALELPGVRLAPGVELQPEQISAMLIAVVTHRSIGRQQASPGMRSHQPGSLPSRWLGTGRTRQNQNWQPPRR